LIVPDRNHKSLFVASVVSAVEPVEFPLPNGGEAFWLDDRTVGYVVVHEETKTAGLHSLSVHLTDASLDLTPDPLPALPLGTFPPASSPSSFRYAAKAGVLVFSDSVYEDGELTKVLENDERWEDRGDNALVYDDTYERHWDTWTGPKRPSLFTVRLFKDASEKRWQFGDRFYNVLNGTGHVRSWPFSSSFLALLTLDQHAPVEPFGGANDYDVSENHIVYTTKDPDLPEAWHTKQNVRNSHPIPRP
jgi:hypothetical protein